MTETRIGRGASRFNHWLAERDYRPLWHAVSVLVILITGCFLFHRYIVKPGMLMAVDMTWPSTVSRMQFNVVNTWVPYGSMPNLGSLEWFFWIYPTSTIANLLNLSASQYMFAMFYGVFCFAGISMYVLAFRTIRSLKIEDSAPYAPYVGAILAGVIYMYNPFSYPMLRQYFAFPIYAALPLLFLALVKTFDSPSLKNIVLFSLFVTVVNTSHHLVWFLGLLFSYLLYYIMISKPTTEALKKSLKAVFGILSLYFFLNAVWTLPYIGTRVAGKAVIPYYSPLLSPAVLQGLSQFNHLVNNFRLTSNAALPFETVNGGALTQAFLFAIPLLSIAALVALRREIKNNRTVNYWAAIAVIGLLLATGTSYILRVPYNYMVFDAPGSGSLGWMLRYTERWLFFVVPFFSLMPGILLSKLFKRRPAGVKAFAFTDHLRAMATAKPPDAGPSGGLSPALSGEERIDAIERRFAFANYRRSLVTAIVVVGIVVVSMYPRAIHFATGEFSPAYVPDDYAKMQGFLDGTSGEPRVAWVPFYGTMQSTYSWAPTKKVGWYNVMSSNPGLSSVFQVMDNESYFNWLQNTFTPKTLPEEQLADPDFMVKKDLMSLMFLPFSAQYLMLDKSLGGPDFSKAFRDDASLDLEYSTKFLRAYKTNYEPGYFWAAANTINADSFFDNLAFVQKLPRAHSHNLAFTDGELFLGDKPSVEAKYGGIDLGPYMRVVNGNPGFENLDESGEPLNWARFFWGDNSTLSIDEKNKSEGKRSLKIVNSGTESFAFGYVVGDEIEVQQGSICAMGTRVKYKNANWTHATVEGYKADTDEWIKLAMCPTIREGNSKGWGKYYCSFLLPPGITKIRPLLGGGWSRDPEKGSAVTWFDDIKVFVVDSGIYGRLASRPPAPEVTFEKLTAEKYKVHVHGAKAPFLLVQSEAHDGTWVARTGDGKIIDSQPVFNTINGYSIDITGDFELTIEYVSQNWFPAGLLITLITLILCALYLLYIWKIKRALFSRGLHPAAIFMKMMGGRTDGEPTRTQGALRRFATGARRFLEEPPRRQWGRKGR